MTGIVLGLVFVQFRESGMDDKRQVRYTPGMKLRLKYKMIQKMEFRLNIFCTARLTVMYLGL
jgi:hypothetical protein